MLSIIIDTLKRIWNAPTHFEMQVVYSFADIDPSRTPLCGAPVGGMMSREWRDVTCEKCRDMKPIYYYEEAN